MHRADLWGGTAREETSPSHPRAALGWLWGHQHLLAVRQSTESGLGWQVTINHPRPSRSKGAFSKPDLYRCWRRWFGKLSPRGWQLFCFTGRQKQAVLYWLVAIISRNDPTILNAQEIFLLNSSRKGWLDLLQGSEGLAGSANLLPGAFGIGVTGIHQQALSQPCSVALAAREVPPPPGLWKPLVHETEEAIRTERSQAFIISTQWALFWLSSSQREPGWCASSVCLRCSLSFWGWLPPRVVWLFYFTESFSNM